MLKKANITVAFTGDEESTGKPLSISRKSLIEAGKKADIALGFENATSFEKCHYCQTWSFRLESRKPRGKRAHSSGVFNKSVGAGAIFEMSRILNAFYEEVTR